jgi:hypothetical protein
MKVSNNQSGNMALVAIAVVAGLVIGFAGAKVMDHNKKTTTTTASSTSTGVTPSERKLSDDLVTLGVEHMILTDQAVNAALDGSKNADAVGKALYSNGTDIGAAVGSVYGAAAQTQFNTLWKLHLDQFVAYAVADSKGDAAGKAAALSTIQTGYTVPLATFLAGATKLPEKTLQDDLAGHVAMTATMIDDHVAGNYTDETAELNMANQHIEAIFSTLATGIAGANPTKFAN